MSLQRGWSLPFVGGSPPDHQLVPAGANNALQHLQFGPMAMPGQSLALVPWPLGAQHGGSIPSPMHMPMQQPPAEMQHAESADDKKPVSSPAKSSDSSSSSSSDSPPKKKAKHTKKGKSSKEKKGKKKSAKKSGSESSTSSSNSDAADTSRLHKGWARLGFQAKNSYPKKRRWAIVRKILGDRRALCNVRAACASLLSRSLSVVLTRHGSFALALY